jgi:hypothetical protein
MAEKSDANDSSTKSRGSSASLLIVGMLALGVSIWAFIGPAAMPGTGSVPLGWIVVISAIVIGILLVISPRKPR